MAAGQSQVDRERMRNVYKGARAGGEGGDPIFTAQMFLMCDQARPSDAARLSAIVLGCLQELTSGQ